MMIPSVEAGELAAQGMGSRDSGAVAMKSQRPIDVLRNSAKTGRIGGDGDDSAITEMIPIGDKLYFVKERGIYAMQLADQIDPQRTNADIPDTQQKILPIGSNDPLVARTLLTAHTLFNQTLMGASFDRQKGLMLALEVLKNIAALSDMRSSLEAAEAAARASYEPQTPQRGTLRLPSIGDAKSRCDAFAQKAGHVVDALEEMAKLFYGREIASKWIDSLSRIAVERYGPDSPFAEYMRVVGPFLLLVRELRNMIEHPKPDKRITVNDFHLVPSGEIALPSVKIVRPGQETATATITLLMKQWTDDLVSVTEVLLAHLCGAHVQPFAGFPVQVVELPSEQRSHKHQRFYFGHFDGQRIIRMG